ncbi:MAG: sugar transferase [Staphylococcus aureus]
MYKNYIKRILDVVISLICIVVLIPFYILISLVVLLKMGRPVLFSQERIGKGEKTFRLYKFRSMTNAKDRNGNLLEEEKRLTKTGIFLRSSSLDELPEFFSILKGDMSLVGPRPLPTYYGPYFRNEERKRHMVKGGLIRRTAYHTRYLPLGKSNLNMKFIMRNMSHYCWTLR